MEWPHLSTSAGRKNAASCSLSLAPRSFTTAIASAVKSNTLSRDCVLGACSHSRSTTHRSVRSRVPSTASGLSLSAASRCSTAWMCALKSFPKRSA